MIGGSVRYWARISATERSSRHSPRHGLSSGTRIRPDSKGRRGQVGKADRAGLLLTRYRRELSTQRGRQRPDRAGQRGDWHSGTARTPRHRARGRSRHLSLAKAAYDSRACQAPFAEDRSRAASRRTNCDLRDRALSPNRCHSKRDCQSLQPIRQQHLPARRRLRDQQRPDLPKSWHRRRRHADLQRGQHGQGRSACVLASERPGRTDARRRLRAYLDGSTGVNDGEGYGGGFYWAGGGAGTKDGETARGWPVLVQLLRISAGLRSQPVQVRTSQMDVGEADLYVQETVGPSLVSPAGLWQSQGWIRGDWNVYFWGDSPSGLCGLAASVNGQSVASVSSGQNPSVWHQCSAPGISQTIHTWQYGQWPDAADAERLGRGGPSRWSYTRTIFVDNSQPTVSLSGPTNAASTAGTQYVTATGGAGPSGVRGISCSVDNAPAHWYPSSTARVPVAGVGEHSVKCQASNNARDAGGNFNWSAAAGWSMKIGDPTVSGIAFGRIVNAPRCERVKVRVDVPARWVTVRRHHKLVKVKRRAHSTLKMVTKCHPRTTIKRVAVRVRVRRHGKTVWVIRHKRKRVVLLPHIRNSTQLRVGHGRSAIVSGWLGTYAGDALAGQRVTVLAAADNGLGQFASVATAITAPNGTWSARVARGPVEAHRGRVQRRSHDGVLGVGSGEADCACQGRAAQRHASPGCLGRNRPSSRSARRRLPATRRSPRTPAYRPRVCPDDLWRARSRWRQWALRYDLHLRARTRERAPRLLVRSGVAPHRRLSLRSREEPPADRFRWRSPTAAAAPPPPQEEAPSFSVTGASARTKARGRELGSSGGRLRRGGERAGGAWAG